MGNTQSIGSGIGDIFWPDNPNRRNRAFQLQDDCQRAIEEFNNLKAKYDKDVVRVKDIMDKYLQEHGFSSVQHLDQAVQNVLKGEELQKWQDLKKALSTNNIISDIVTTISGLAIVAGAGTVGLLVLVGAMSGPVGWAALGTVATIAAIVGAVVLKLRDAIHNLFDKRQEVYVQLRTLQAFSWWIAKFELFFLDEDLAKHPDKFAKQYQSVFQQQADEAKAKAVAEELAQLDRDRHAWTNEDPNPNINSTMRTTTEPVQREPKPMRQFILTDQEDNRYSFDAQIVTQDGHNAREQCVIEDVNTKESWIMKAEVSADQKDQRTIALQDVLFILSKVGDTAVVLENCKLSFPSL
ncbi:hypothetical protein F5B21DRAFT_527280 [Xylaria acuta]|nr:hypothetical protein F5B21DRAFT_527280 [Xylaria acuta]